MARLTPKDVQQTSPILSGFAIAYSQASNLIAQKAIPVMGVERDSGDFFVQDAGNFFRVDDVNRASGGRYNNGQPALSKVAYNTRERGFQVPLDDDVADNADSAIVDQMHTEMAAQRVLLDLEIQAAALLQTTGNYLASSAGSTNVSWATASTATPITDIATAKEVIRARIGQDPDTMVLSAAAFSKMIQTAQVLGRITGVITSGVSSLTPQLVGSIVGIPNILVGGAAYLTSLEGKTDAYADVWNDNVALLVAKPASLGSANFAMNFSRYGTDLLVAESFYDDNIRSEVYRARAKYDLKVTSAASGFLLTSVLT